MEISSELFKLASVGLVSGLFSSFLAYRAHRQKKWWELRVTAYQELVESLSDLSLYYSKHYNAELLKYDLSPEYKKQLNEILNESHRKVRRAADKGAFIFSTEVNSALEEYIKCDDSREDTFYEHVEKHEHEVKKCLSAITKASKKDLKTRWWWL